MRGVKARRSGRVIASFVAVGSLVLSAVGVLYVLGIRSRSSTVRDAARRFHRAVGDPLQMRTAGERGSFASVIEHRGRASGMTYETPVWAAPTEDGFVIALVYGSRTDWLKNVLASGTGAIVHDGRTFPVDQPEVVLMESARVYFPAALQRTHRLIRVDRCLRVRRIEGARGRKEGTMNEQLRGEVVPYPKARRFMREAIRSTHRKPLMHGLLEVDVTEARRYLEDVKARTGESLSFTAFVIACLGRAIEEHPYVHALWKGRHHLIQFRDVDVLTWIERDIGGDTHVFPCIVRAANRKTFPEIHEDIRAAQVEDVTTIDVGGAKASQALPGWLFRPYFASATRIGKWFPGEWKRLWGTVTLSAVGMVGAGAGWGIPPSSPSICWVTVGGIGQKREDVDGQTVVREFLSLTVSVDHNMVDGAPAARFTERLKELIESGYGLPLREETTAEPIATERVGAA